MIIPSLPHTNWQWSSRICTSQVYDLSNPSWAGVQWCSSPSH